MIIELLILEHNLGIIYLKLFFLKIGGLIALIIVGYP